MLVRVGVVIVTMLILLPVRGNAQEVDSLSVIEAGKAAANEVPVLPYGLVGFLGGAVFGYRTLSLFGEGSIREKVAAGAGVAAVLVTSSRASAASKVIPGSVRASIAHRDAEYQAAFTQSYTQHLNYRLQKSVFGGAFLGGVAGFVSILAGFALASR